jgi:hypothetical protein
MFSRFDGTWKAIGALADAKDPSTSGLAKAFADEVIRP